MTRRSRELATYAATAIACGTIAAFSLRLRPLLWPRDPSPLRYSGIGGAYLAITDFAFAFCFGAELGLSLAARRMQPRNEPLHWPWVLDVVAAVILAYLVIAVNFGRCSPAA